MKPDSAKVSSLPAHFPAFDGVRCLAILVVMLFHFIQDIEHTQVVDRVTYYAFRMGWVGVDLFFVLSGFLITGILLDTKTRPHSLRTFYWRRAMRIFPLYYALLAVLFVGPHFFDGLRSESFEATKGLEPWYWLYAANWLFAAREQFVAYAHLWSLAVEEQFYLVWPALVLGLSARALKRVCVGCIVGALLFRVGSVLLGYDEIVGNVLTPARLDTLAIGAYLAASLREPQGLARLWPRLRIAALVCSAGLVLVIAHQKGLWWHTPVVITFGMTALTIVFGALVAFAITARSAHPVIGALSSAPLRFFGKYSYGLYIIHPFVQSALLVWVPPRLLPTVFGVHLPGYLVFMTACMLASIVAALVSFHAYEKHWLKLKGLV